LTIKNQLKKTYVKVTYLNSGAVKSLHARARLKCFILYTSKMWCATLWAFTHHYQHTRYQCTYLCAFLGAFKCKIKSENLSL